MRLIYAKLAGAISLEYQPFTGWFRIARAAFPVAVAWKSLNSSAGLPLKGPLEMSTTISPSVLKGFVPAWLALLILSVTETMTALSGSAPVLNERMARNWRSYALSPSLKTTAVLSRDPPTLLFSPDSTTWPSRVAAETNVRVKRIALAVAVGVCEGMTVAVLVAVFVGVLVGVPVGVFVAVFVAVTEAVEVGVLV